MDVSGCRCKISSIKFVGFSLQAKVPNSIYKKLLWKQKDCLRISFPCYNRKGLVLSYIKVKPVIGFLTSCSIQKKHKSAIFYKFRNEKYDWSIQKCKLLLSWQQWWHCTLTLVFTFFHWLLSKRGKIFNFYDYDVPPSLYNLPGF